MGEEELATGRRGGEVRGLVYRDSPIIPPKDAGTLVGSIPVTVFLHDVVNTRH